MPNKTFIQPTTIPEENGGGGEEYPLKQICRMNIHKTASISVFNYAIMLYNFLYNEMGEWVISILALEHLQYVIICSDSQLYVTVSSCKEFVFLLMQRGYIC